jgi:hypothetical protein
LACELDARGKFGHDDEKFESLSNRLENLHRTKLDTRMTNVRAIIVAAAVATSGIGCLSEAAAAGAPAALLNKTISVSWAQTTVQRDDSGRTVNPTINHQRTIYISSQGRIFSRAVRSINNRGFSGSKTGQLAPGDNKGYAGGAASLVFQGSELVGTQAHVSGAGQMRVSFDPSFSSCKVKVIYGRAGGNMRWKGLDGRMYEALSNTTSGESCSISAGNAFAN